VSTRTAALQPADLHDEAFARNPFPVWERLRHEAPLFHDTIDDVHLLTRYEDVAEVLRDDVTYSTWIYKLSRLEAREGLVRLFRDRRPALSEELPPLRLHQYHLTVPTLRVTLTHGGLA
jgi:hypothetical protein